MGYNPENFLVRAKAVQEEKSTSISKFAAALQMQQVRVNNYFRGKSKSIDLEFASAILDTFPDISAEWLMRGVGSMIKNEANSPNEESASYEMKSNNEVDVLRLENTKIKEQIDTLYGIIKKLTGK